MMKKNSEKEKHEVSIGAETLSMIDAQCEEHNCDRQKLIDMMARIFLDFTHMAGVVGKDIFTFRDDMIKAIIKAKGQDIKIDGISEGRDQDILKIAGTPHVVALLKNMVAELNKIALHNDHFKDARHHHHAKDEHPAISIDKIAMEFKDPGPPTYKQKRKKLDKLKF